MTNDPTYIRAEIDANPEWRLAFQLSEVDNDSAPLGWWRYIAIARGLLSRYDMTDRNPPGQNPVPTSGLNIKGEA